MKLTAYSQEWIFKELFNSREFANIEFTSYHYSSEGFIYIGTTGGLFKTDGYQNTKIPLADSIENESITSIAEYAPDIVLIGTENGHLLKIRLPSGEVDYLANAGAEIREIWISPQHDFWLATYGNGLVHYDDSLQTAEGIEGLLDEYCYCLEPDQKGRLWVGSDRGINVLALDGSVIHSIGHAEGLPDIMVMALYLDDQQRMWIGMESSGICYMDNSPGIDEVIYPDPSWNFGSVTSFLQSRNEIIASTSRNGIIHIEKAEAAGMFHKNASSASADLEIRHARGPSWEYNYSYPQKYPAYSW